MSSLSADSKKSLYGTPAFDVAGEAMMSFSPINSIHQHLCAFHYYAHDRTRQVEAHHFCHHWSEDLHQCVIYDSDETNARIIGIEYIIPESVFKALDVQEKRYWHSHKYEVESGMLVMQMKESVPNVMNDLAEKPVMLALQTTYGKTVHTWQPDIHPDIPLGPPTLMMAFTTPSTLDPALLRARDEKLGISTDAKKKARAEYLPNYGGSAAMAEGCDEGERTGRSLQFVPEERQVKT